MLCGVSEPSWATPLIFATLLFYYFCPRVAVARRKAGAIETGVQNPTISAEDALIVATSTALIQVWVATINAPCALIVGIKFLPPELSVHQFQLHPKEAPKEGILQPTFE